HLLRSVRADVLEGGDVLDHGGAITRREGEDRGSRRWVSAADRLSGEVDDPIDVAVVANRTVEVAGKVHPLVGYPLAALANLVDKASALYGCRLHEILAFHSPVHAVPRADA